MPLRQLPPVRDATPRDAAALLELWGASCRTAAGVAQAGVSAAQAVRDAFAYTGGAALVSATNGKTTTTAMVAEILRGRRLAWNSSGANLVSGIASTLLDSRDVILLSWFLAHVEEEEWADRTPRLLAVLLERRSVDRDGSAESASGPANSCKVVGLPRKVGLSNTR